MSKHEGWSSRTGVILAVAGSAVGIGNFLRFPGNAAQYGGGAFMIAYVVAFLLIGLPMCWAEWSMGRRAGREGFHSSPGIFNVFSRSRFPKYFGVLGMVIPVIVCMYYVCIEAWCLGYAVNYLFGNMHFEEVKDSGGFFAQFTGLRENGSALGFRLDQVGAFLIVVFFFNFFLIYRGLSKGIEWFCRYAMPTLLILAVVVLVRVLTLGAPDPANLENSVNNGLGFLWNPSKVYLEKLDLEGDAWNRERQLVGELARGEAELLVADSEVFRIVEEPVWTQLRNPQLWLAASGQIFFSLSVGIGVILTYSSYMKRNDDLVLSGLTATSTNEFCEVTLGGLITVPAAVAFLGVSGLAGVGMSTFALGFNVLPLVFSQMVGGPVFGFLFFFLLFLAAVTSSLSMLQPGIAFLEEALTLSRKQSVAILGFITSMGTIFVLYFSADLKALDTLDFWAGTFLIYVLATGQIVMFGWVWGVDNGLREAHVGASFRIPSVFGFVIKWVTPLFLVGIFVLFVLFNVLGVSLDGESKLSHYITDLFGEHPDRVAWMSVSIILLTGLFFGLMISQVDKYRQFQVTGRRRTDDDHGGGS